jgi:predicted nucleic acid-binding protein
VTSAKGKLQFNTAISENDPLQITPIPIDETFVTKYYAVDLPYLKAGDLIFVAMAKGDGSVLITEDDTQYKKAKEAGVTVYRIKEYLTAQSGASA